MFYDVAIIGGGPAGSAAGLSLMQLAPHARVVLFEASGYDTWRHGEVLSGEARGILESLRCWEQLAGTGLLPCHGNRAAWGSAEPYDNEFIFSLHGSSWRLDRRSFDRTLCECARAAGVEVLTGARVTESSATADGAWSLGLPGANPGWIRDRRQRPALLLREPARCEAPAGRSPGRRSADV